MHTCDRCGVPWDEDGVFFKRPGGQVSLCAACRAELTRRARAALDAFQEVEEPPLAIDLTAVSTQKDVPAFASPPPGAEPYYGFSVMEDVTVGGFTLGKITDFERQPLQYGDAFVVAPDGSR